VTPFEEQNYIGLDGDERTTIAYVILWLSIAESPEIGKGG
jgi:hypothetical protein